jgi:hypothetical protein
VHAEPILIENMKLVMMAAGTVGPPAENEAAPVEEPTFLAFKGTGRRLDGRPAVGGPPVPVTSTSGIRRPPPPTGLFLKFALRSLVT